MEFETEIRMKQKVRSKRNGTERQKPWKWKGKQSMGKNETETQKEEIWNITIFLLPHSPYSAHICHLLPSFYIWDNATIALYVLLLLFAIFLISIYLPLCYLTTLLLAHTSPYSLAIDLHALLVFK